MNKTEFPNKYYKLIKDSPFVEEMDSSDLDALKAKIVECEEKIYNIEKAKEIDDKLNSAKELVKEYSAAYNEAAAYEKAKVKYCIFLMESRGHEIKSVEDE